MSVADDMNLGGPSACKFTVRKEPHGSVTVAHSRLGALSTTVFALVFFTVWYWLILQSPASVADALHAVRSFSDGKWFMWFFALVPLLALPSLSADLKTVLAGRFFRFDATSRTISQGRRRVAYFDDVSSIQIRTIHKSEQADEYLLSLLLGDQSKVRVALSTDRGLIVSAADELADLLNVKIVASDRRVKATDPVIAGSGNSGQGP